MFDSIKTFFDERYCEHMEVRAEKEDYACDLPIKHLPPDKKHKVLDLGCGTGLYTSDINDIGCTVTGADISSVAIDKLRQRGIEGFCWNAVEKIEAGNNSYDAVIALDLLELLPDPFFFQR